MTRGPLTVAEIENRRFAIIEAEYYRHKPRVAGLSAALREDLKLYGREYETRTGRPFQVIGGNQ